MDRRARSARPPQRRAEDRTAPARSSLHHRAGLDAVHRADLRAQRTADAGRLVDLDLVPAFEHLVAPAQGRTAEIHAGLTRIALPGDHLQRRSLDLYRIEDARPVGDENRNAAI